MKFSTKLPHDIQKTARRKLVMLNAVESINDLMNNLNLTAEQAMTALGIPQEKRSMFLKKINQEDAEN